MPTSLILRQCRKLKYPLLAIRGPWRQPSITTSSLTRPGAKSPFTTYKVAPLRPTSLETHRYVPLAATDLNFYSVMNSWTVPGPLDVDRLRQSLAKALQLFPLHCGSLARNPSDNSFCVKLCNRPVELSVGTSDNPGPFADDWNGDEHPDYYFELYRGTVSNTINEPLFKAKVTTWTQTGQTSIFISQSYALGDGFNLLHFVKAWSALYQGKQPDVIPTFEKNFLLPTPKFDVRADNTLLLQPLSHMAVDFDAEFLNQRHADLLRDTVRVDIDIPGAFVNRIHQRVKQHPSVSERTSQGDAFGGYLMHLLQNSLDNPVSSIQQLVTIRDRPMHYGGDLITMPSSAQGNLYMVWTAPIQTPLKEQTPATNAVELFQARRMSRDPHRLGQSYMLYNAFFERSISLNRMFVECGFADAIGFNWLVNAGLSNPDFGYPMQASFIEWESLINFIQVWRANAIKQPDGEVRQDPSGLHVLFRTPYKNAISFLGKLVADMEAADDCHGDYATSPASLLERLKRQNP